jgi:hypothetical protein
LADKEAFRQRQKIPAQKFASAAECDMICLATEPPAFSRLPGLRPVREAPWQIKAQV